MSKNMETILSHLIALAIVVAFVVTFFTLTSHPFAHEVESYTEGYEISHMEKDLYYFYISARNDHDSFTIPVSRECFGRYAEGEVIEVEVRVMEDWHTFVEYSILGYEVQ